MHNRFFYLGFPPTTLTHPLIYHGLKRGMGIDFHGGLDFHLLDPHHARRTSSPQQDYGVFRGTKDLKIPLTPFAKGGT